MALYHVYRFDREFRLDNLLKALENFNRQHGGPPAAIAVSKNSLEAARQALAGYGLGQAITLKPVGGCFKTEIWLQLPEKPKCQQMAMELTA
jgi:hypothetical protein